MSSEGLCAVIGEDSALSGARSLALFDHFDFVYQVEKNTSTVLKQVTLLINTDALDCIVSTIN